MYKHSTTHRTLSRRLAALLAALALLAAMALPVYAETLDGAAQMQETVETDNNGETDNNDETDSDDETDDKSGANEGTGTGADTDSNDTNDNASPNPGANSTTQADNAAADKNAPYEEKTDLTKEDTADGGEGPADEAGAKETFFEADTCSEDETESDDRSAPMTASNEGGTASFIPNTVTVYFAVDNTKYQENYRINFYAQRTKDGSDRDLNRYMLDTGETIDGRKIFKVTLSQTDYPEGGFYRLIFQYYEGDTHKGEIFAFGGHNYDDNSYKWTTIDQIAGKRFDGISKDNVDNAYNDSQWTRVEYYYKDTPLYFKNESSTALTDVTATFFKLENGELKQTVSQPIGQVDAGKLAAQQIRIPDNESRFVQFTWGKSGQSALYDFTTDYTEGSTPAAQKLDLTTANCYVYNNGTADSWASAGADLLTEGKTIYFDATLSEYSYKGEGIENAAMPGADKTLYCLLTDSGGVVTPQKMEQETTATAPDAPIDPSPDTPAKRKLWYCEIPKDGKTYTAVQFSTKADPSAPAYNKTKQYSTAQIPPTLQEPCFFADDGDPTAYTGESRDGYWGEKDSIRDAESGKNKTVVDIASGEFTQKPGTKYITSTLYDYYTDYELNGLNRDTYSWVTTSSQRGYVTFEQFNRALSSAYSAGNVKYPLYTGHFQKSGWGDPFATVAPGMGLYGWDVEGSSDYNIFMAVNNSALDDSGRESSDYKRTFQGLVESKTSDGTADGLPLLRTKNSTGSTTTAMADPHFNKDFLQGKNTINTVLGKVYEDVSFPLKKSCVFAKDPNNPADDDPEGKAEYWYYDSSKSSLYLKQNQTDGKYYLESTTDSSGKPITDSKSQNISAPNSANGTYGFFPFNETVNTVGASQYNYGFGAKLQFDFTLTKNGNVVVGKDGNRKEVPIKFFFSGDDDVWVYIDGELMLDVGGAHGKASGLLEFGENNTVIPYVSSNKNTDPNDPMVYKGYKPGETTKTVNYNSQAITFDKKGTQKTLKDKPTHTLTMYYMERGMWESNMAVAFNFPDHNELQVEKKVDVSDVNPLFQDSFKNQKIFTFNIQNLATHYEAQETVKPKIEKYELPKTVYESATKPLKYVSTPPVDADKDRAVLWESDKADPTSEHRADRRGTLTWDTAIDIRKYSYLTFDVYVEGKQEETCALSNLYVELWDTTGNNQMGCLGTKGLQSSDVYGAATALHPGQWYTVRLMLNSLKKDKDFNNQVTKITVGDNYARSIYLRNFTFSSAPTLPPQTGFTTAQYDVPDYGSATSGNLENAAYAVFSSNLGNGDVVDENGQFLLQAGETVTFNDQFRRGSYIALKELTDTELYDTSWTVCENGVPVTKVSGNGDVVTAGKVTNLQNVSTTTPNDGRTEKVVGESLDGHPIQNKYTDAKKPEADTLVFRSYSDKADPNELTKLKVVFTNKVKTGKLVIRKVPADGEGEQLKNKTFTFTVQFGDVGGQSLGDEIPLQTRTCKVEKHADGYYGQIVIDKIPVGTRFVVSEIPTEGTSLKSVHIEGGKDCATTADGMAYGTIAEGDEKAAKATFENTARELIDITVNKVWQKQDGKTEIPQDELPNAIYLQLQRTETPNDAGSWQTVTSVELKKPTDYNGWTTQFTGLDKYDASKPGDDQTPYTYRVLESATGKDEDWHGGADGDVIRIDGKKYEVLNTTVTGGSDDKTLTLTNKLQDPRFNLKVIKADAEKTDTKLKDVEFKLEKLKKGTNNNLVVDDTFPAITGKTNDKGELWVTKDGKPVEGFTELEAGIYQLTEIKAADGYNLLSGPIQIEFTKDHECKLNSVNANSDIFKPNLDGSYTLTLTVLNRKTPALPHTGADAPSLWLLIGLPLAVAGLLILVFRYNKKGGRTR